MTEVTLINYSNYKISPNSMKDPRYMNMLMDELKVNDAKGKSLIKDQPKGKLSKSRISDLEKSDIYRKKK
jgi:hypothetical protein